MNGTDYYYTYDDNGNMTSGPDFTNPAQITSRTIIYNADNMPVQIEHGGTVVTNFIYDGNGARAKKDVQGGGTTYYVNNNFEVINGEPVGYIFAGNLRIAKITASDSNYFHKDHLGSSTVMTDETGIQVEASEYMPFGHLRDHIGTEVTDYKFTDQELDTSTNLYNYDARLYDPVIGRFISPDPNVPYLYDPQSLNHYSYCRNNPIKYIDPTGFVDLEALGVSLGMIGGGALSIGVAAFAGASVVGLPVTAISYTVGTFAISKGIVGFWKAIMTDEEENVPDLPDAFTVIDNIQISEKAKLYGKLGAVVLENTIPEAKPKSKALKDLVTAKEIIDKLNDINTSIEAYDKYEEQTSNNQSSNDRGSKNINEEPNGYGAMGAD